MSVFSCSGRVISEFCKKTNFRQKYQEKHQKYHGIDYMIQSWISVMFNLKTPFRLQVRYLRGHEGPRGNG